MPKLVERTKHFEIKGKLLQARSLLPTWLKLKFLYWNYDSSTHSLVAKGEGGYYLTLVNDEVKLFRYEKEKFDYSHLIVKGEEKKSSFSHKVTPVVNLFDRSQNASA